MNKVRFSWALLAGLIPCTSSYAAVYSVANGDVAGLVSAVQRASASPEADTIKLAGNGNYTLFSANLHDQDGPTALPLIRGDLRILGAGAVIQRALNAPGFRLLKVADSAHLELDGLTLHNGYAGYDDDTIPYGDGGAILAYGKLTITDCRFTANRGRIGGAINTTADTSIDISTFHGNVAHSLTAGTGSQGGALRIGQERFDRPEPRLTIKRSLFQQNKVQTDRGNVSGKGGALLLGYSGNSAGNSAGNSIDASTFVFNSAQDGGAIYAFDALLITNSTLSFNTARREGGAIKATSEVNEYGLTLQHSTLVGNVAAEGGGAIDLRSERNSVINNLLSENSSPACASYFWPPIQNVGNWISDGSCQPARSGNPQLGSYGANGGPTPTHELELGSLAIGAAAASECLSHDQRGLPRSSSGPACDVGAVEHTLRFVPSVPVVTRPDPYRMVCDPLQNTIDITLLGSQRFSAKEAVPTTITLGAMKVGLDSAKNVQISDVNKDGEADLTLQLPAAEVYKGRSCSSTTALQFKGQMNSGAALFGSMLVHPSTRK